MLRIATPKSLDSALKVVLSAAPAGSSEEALMRMPLDKRSADRCTRAVLDRRLVSSDSNPELHPLLPIDILHYLSKSRPSPYTL